MDTFVIVGGGFSGLLAAHELKKRGLPFVGFERGEHLGGVALTGNLRLYASDSVEFLTQRLSNLNFKKIESAPQILEKGVWKSIESPIGDDEDLYLKTPYFKADTPYIYLIEELCKEVQEHFSLRKEVIEILHDTAEISFQDGSKQKFGHLIWCAPLDALKKMWGSGTLYDLKEPKKASAPNGGVYLDLEVSSPIFQGDQTVVIPFKFKDRKMHALCTAEEVGSGNDAKYFARWLLFIDDDLKEDHEETAKCIKAMHRGIEKEFPNLKEKVKQERIVFLHNVSCRTPSQAKTIEIMPKVIYVGTQVTLQDSEQAGGSLDRIIDNCRHLETLLDTSINN